MKHLACVLLTGVVAACSSGGDNIVIPDAHRNVDARIGVADATVIDAPPVVPDSPPVVPDTAPVIDAPRPDATPPIDAPPIDAPAPDAPVSPPDAHVSPPDAHVSPPDAHVSPPDAHIAPPDAMVTPDAGITASATVGAAGGTVSGGGVTVIIPRHALDHDEVITISTPVASGPAGAHTPVYALGPADLVFARPVTVQIVANYTAGQTPACFYSVYQDTTFEDLGGTFAAGTLTCKVVHFSRGYAGESSGARTIYGTDFVTFIHEASIENFALDQSASTIQALVPDGHGGYTTIDGAEAGPGFFAIPNVPTGEALINLDGLYVDTSADAIDRGFDIGGRSDAVGPTTTTKVVFNVTNLEAWDTNNDDLDFFSTGADTWYPQLEATASRGAPGRNATSLSNLTVDTNTSCLTSAGFVPGNLIDGSEGDLSTLAQHDVAAPTSGPEYARLARIFQPAAFTQTDGGTSTLTGAFVDVSTANHAAINVPTTAFQSFLGLAPASSPFVGVEFDIYAQPYNLDDGNWAIGSNVLDTFADSDLASTGMTYGLPTAGTWAAYASVLTGDQVSFQIPASTAPLTVFSLFAITDEVSALTAGTITPRMGPVQAATIGGASIYTAQTGFGVTPTLTWTKPTTGTPTAYLVLINHLIDNAGTTDQEGVAEIVTANTSLTLPPGLLTAGEPYYVIIRAVDNEPIAESHFRFYIPQSTTDATSAILTP